MSEEIKKKIVEEKERIVLISKISAQILHEKTILTRIEELNKRKNELKFPS